MNSLIDVFINDPNYDPNMSMDKIVKDWEMNFLGNGKHNEEFNYSLETDTSFGNALHDTKQERNGLKMLFDSSLNPDAIRRFTCINKDAMETYEPKDKLSDKNTWTIMRHCDYVGKPFFRFKLKRNLTDTNINHLLYLLSDCSFEVSMGGSQMLKVDKLLFNFLICQKLNKPIQTLNVRNFLEEYTMDEIKSMILEKESDKFTTINQKYYFASKDDIYLDIPLLIDFYSYNISTILIALQYHDVRYQFNVPQHKLNLINNYVEQTTLMFEEITYAETDFRRGLAQNAYDFIKMKSITNYWPNMSENIIEWKPCFPFMKFIFIILRQEFIVDTGEDGFMNFDSDIDITQFPQIIGIETTVQNKDGHIVGTKNIDLANVWFTQYNNMVIYGVAVDGHSDMNNWVRVTNECIESTDKLNLVSSDSSNQYNKYNSKTSVNNLNLENYQEKFLVERIEKIKIVFSDSSVKPNVEVVEIHNNLQRVVSGMTGDAYPN